MKDRYSGTFRGAGSGSGGASRGGAVGGGGARKVSHLNPNGYNPYGKVERDFQNRVSIAVKRSQEAARKAESDRMARQFGNPTQSTKKNSIPTNTELNRMSEQSLKRRAVNENISKAKRTGTKAGVSAAGAGAVAAAMPKKKTNGAEGPKRSMPTKKSTKGK